MPNNRGISIPNISKTPISDEMLQNEWPIFAACVYGRLDVGRTCYGDPSFSLPTTNLASEIKQEIADQMGWSFILWCRVVELENKLAAFESQYLVTK